MLSATLKTPGLEINPKVFNEIQPSTTSPTNYDLKNNTSIFDPSSMSQTPPGVFTNTLKERIQMYYSLSCSTNTHK